MQPAYHAHESVYRRLDAAGRRWWNEGGRKRPIEPGVRAFLNDALRQAWCPRPGRALELGCGTAPILRWLHARGWGGAGIDVSPTAIRMARREAQGTGLRFVAADVLRYRGFRAGSFDLVVDGQCFHCLTDLADREHFLRETARLLRPGGVFVLLTMARPVLTRAFRAAFGPLQDDIAWLPLADARTFRGARRLDGKWCVPTRRLEPWPRTLRQLAGAGLEPRLVRVHACHEQDPLSYLSVGAVRVK